MSVYTNHDVIIIGSGCAGLAAGIYTSRAGLNTLILEKETMGGEMMNRQLIENYPGFSNGIPGPDLGSAMLEQAANFGAEIEFGEVTNIKDKKGLKMVKTIDQMRTCNGVIIATGSHPRKLQVPGEEEFANKGVFYCATCDGARVAGKKVAVAGAGDSGVTEGLHLERLGCEVTIIELLNEAKASKVLFDRALSNPNIEIKLGSKIEGIIGDEWVTGINIEDVNTNKNNCLPVDGVFVRIGVIPNTDFLQGILTLNSAGQVLVSENMEASVPGIFAAGDIRHNSPMQMATAVGDGVTAAMAAGRYISSL